MNEKIRAVTWNNTLAILFGPSVVFSRCKIFSDQISYNDDSILIANQEVGDGLEIILNVFSDGLIPEQEALLSQCVIEMKEDPSELLFGEAYSGMNTDEFIEFEKGFYSLSLFDSDNEYFLKVNKV